jgi:hypothetical protein
MSLDESVMMNEWNMMRGEELQVNMQGCTTLEGCGDVEG